MKKLAYIFYVIFAKHLPISDMRFFGGISKKIRGACGKRLFLKMGKNVNIERGVFFGFGCEIEIGDNSGIGRDCQIPQNVKIGKNVLMAPEVVIIAENHRFDRTDVPIRTQSTKRSPAVRISDDVWIGLRAVILPGVQVGRGAVIGAGAIVTKDVLPYSVVAGNPAKIIKMRK